MSVFLLGYLVAALLALLAAFIPNKWLVVSAIIIICITAVLQTGVIHG